VYLKIFGQHKSKKFKVLHPRQSMEVENHEKRKSLDFLEIRPIFLKTDRGSPLPFPRSAFPENRSDVRRGPAHHALSLTAGTVGPIGLPMVSDSDAGRVLPSPASSPPRARLGFQAAPSSLLSPPSVCSYFWWFIGQFNQFINKIDRLIGRHTD
jgi:hypothetical protein